MILKGAFLLLGGIPSIGRTILIIMAVGLVLYIIWRYTTITKYKAILVY